MIPNNLDTANEQQQLIPKGYFQSTVTRLGRKKKKADMMAEMCGEINKQKVKRIIVIMIYDYSILLCKPCVQE